MECYICMLRHGNVIYDTEELNTLRYLHCCTLVYRQIWGKITAIIEYKPFIPIFAPRFCGKQNIYFLRAK